LDAHLEPVDATADEFMGRKKDNNRAAKTKTKILTKLPSKALSESLVKELDSSHRHKDGKVPDLFLNSTRTYTSLYSSLEIS
jgi:hypothetical protein